MGSEWKNQVLSLIRDITRFFHSKVIPESFWHHSMDNMELFFVWMRHSKDNVKIFCVPTSFQPIPAHSNPVLREKGWLPNDRMMVEWLEWGRDGCVLKLIPQPKTVEIGASYWSRAQNRGLWLVERTLKKKSKGLTLIQKCPSFRRHSFILASFHGQSCQSRVRMNWLWVILNY